LNKSNGTISVSGFFYYTIIMKSMKKLACILGFFQNFSFERAASENNRFAGSGPKNRTGRPIGPRARANRVLQEALLCLVFAAFLAAPLGAQEFNKTIAPEIKTAFSKARIPVLRRRTPAIDFTAARIDGTQIRLSGLRGKVVFLNFWATWCPPCREEMPSMEALYQRFRGKDLEFLAVDIQEDAGEVAAFLDEYSLSFPAALDSTGRISERYGIRGIPATFIIDREGGVIAAVTGSRDWNTPEVIAALETLITRGP
jgi:peroxiredoxin